jgi:hypothetical protein
MGKKINQSGKKQEAISRKLGSSPLNRLSRKRDAVTTERGKTARKFA